MIDVIVVLVILLILIAAYRLTASRTDAGCGACKGSCSSCEKGSIYARYRQDHPLDKWNGSSRKALPL